MSFAIGARQVVFDKTGSKTGLLAYNREDNMKITFFRRAAYALLLSLALSLSFGSAAQAAPRAESSVSFAASSAKEPTYYIYQKGKQLLPGTKYNRWYTNKTGATLQAWTVVVYRDETLASRPVVSVSAYGHQFEAGTSVWIASGVLEYSGYTKPEIEALLRGCYRNADIYVSNPDGSIPG